MTTATLDTMDLRAMFANDFKTINAMWNAWAILEAYAQTMRERVDAIEQAALDACPLYEDKRWAESRGKDRRITEPRYVYLTDLNSPAYFEHMAECKYQQDKQGLRAGLDDNLCPALVAEDVARKSKRDLLLYICGEEFCQKLMYSMKYYDEFWELISKIVVNHPSYRKLGA